MSNIARPFIPWVGGKEKLVPYVRQVFPDNVSQYLEPFGGGGAVLLSLPPNPKRLDIYNDLDSELVNLFLCVRERTNALLRELKFLPIHSRVTFERYRDFLEHKEVTMNNILSEMEVLNDRECFTEEQAAELMPIFKERMELYDVQRAAAFYNCSLKHKIGTQEKFCNNYPPCQEVWARGEKVVKFIGYDAGEDYRRVNAISHDMIDTKYKKEYPLIDWGWTREDCVAAIEQESLPLPGKSSCFFCPSMKRHEIRTLYHNHRDLFDRAIAIEDNARPNLISVKGLGRNWSWRDFVEADKNQTAMCWMFPETDMPCGCYDGE